MSRVLALLALCTLLAIVRAILIGLAVVALMTLLFAFVRRPRETLIFIGVMTLSFLATARPLAAIIAIGIVGAVATLSGLRRRLDA